MTLCALWLLAVVLMDFPCDNVEPVCTIRVTACLQLTRGRLPTLNHLLERGRVKPLCEPWGIACSMVDADMANRCILVPHTGYTHIHMYDAWGPNMFTWCSFGLHTVGQVALPVLFCVKE